MSDAVCDIFFLNLAGIGTSNIVPVETVYETSYVDIYSFTFPSSHRSHERR